LKTIGLIDVDGKHFPNLALMKISAWHKQKGDNVVFASLGEYDKLYYSKVFTFTPDFQDGFISGKEVVKGGTGYKNFDKLPDEIEHIQPDYKLYDCVSAYGFLTRGCIRECSWCVVPKKEGKLVANSDISEFIGNMKSAILMDNNVLASDHGLKQIEKIADMGIKIDFNQGLDARIIAGNPDIAKLLARCKWLKPLRMACDTRSQIDSIEKATKLLRDAGCTPKNYFIYCLVKDIDDALSRVDFLKRLNLDPFCQPYINFEDGYVDPELKRFARWVNMKSVFKSVEWEDYK
jgi:hypothetical protein